jgi:hypothetical protein
MANPQLETAAQDFVALLKQHGVEAGQELIGDLNNLQTEFAQSTARVAAAIGEPGIGKVLEAERDVLFLIAATRAINRGDNFDNRLAGIIEGSLTIAARLTLPIP